MKYRLTNPDDLYKFQAKVKHLLETKPVVELTVPQIKRSINQNALLWLWMQFVADFRRELGEDRPKEFWYCQFMQLIPIYYDGTDVRKTSSYYTVAEMKYFLDNIFMFCQTEWGLDLPDPEDKKARDWFEYHGYKFD
jgi:hypothetical protein